MTAPLLQAQGATFRYGKHEALHGVDLDVLRGEVLVILGPNGCGKSTLLRCLGGDLRLHAGRVRLNGTDIATMDAGARARRIGILFQSHTPSFPFTVIDVVCMGRAPHLGLFASPSAADRELAEQCLALIGVAHLKGRPYTEISGGERQLVLLARALVQQPEVILLDEPTAHLDMRNQMLALRAIGKLAAQGVSMVMTTHDPNHAFLFPGRVAMMKQGSLTTIGPASTVITEAALRDTYGLEIGVRAVMDGAGRQAMVCVPWLLKSP